MPTNTSKRIVASFLQFMDGEMQGDGISDEDKQSIEVICQCLQATYTVTATDVPASQKPLVEIFTDVYPEEVIARDLTEEEKEKAENFKIEGNGYMKNGAFDEAIKSYNKAIEIDPTNAVYFCNRAAAQTGKQAYDRALTDCRKALEIDPDYSKAYSRMGLTYSKMEAFDQAVECYEKALKLDPNNEGYKKNLKIAQDKAAGSAPGIPGMPGFPGMPGMPGGFADMLNNPQFMNMAKTVMEDPAMKDMATQLMGKMMSGGAGETSGEGGIANLMNMGQQFAQQMSDEHPEVLDRLRTQMQQQGGAGADTATPPEDKGSSN